jgi:hypothetical protein
MNVTGQNTPDPLKLLPQPQALDWLEGSCPIEAGLPISISPLAAPLLPIIASEWQRELARAASIHTGETPGYTLSAGNPGTCPPEVSSRHPEAYALEITAHGIQAVANSYNGLVHAWQTLKQIIRNHPSELPCLRINDWPHLDWRVYHLDLKGTCRNPANLYAILPQLAELKINAVLAEYENYVRLDRHPDIATPEALGKADVTAWVRAARDYGITVIPLVQTLGHLQYALCKPAYAHLQEKPGDPAEACATHPGTWPLIQDFLEEMIEIHPDSPFIHAGLDETFNIGTCPRCIAALAGRPSKELYADWVNRVCRFVLEQGRTPLVWGDMIIEELDSGMAGRLNREAIYLDWGYRETGPLFPWLRGAPGKLRLSREWLQRPNGEIDELPALKIGPRSRFIEDLPADEQLAIKALADNPQFPLKTRSGIGIRRMAEFGFKTGAVSGIRVSFHGCIAPKFITGQLNTLQWAQVCKNYGSTMLVGSSWSRGGSFASANAHPELDWYGIATLADSGWATLGTDQLRDFDRRFAFQFFGLPDGKIGDLYFCFERTDSRVDHAIDNYLPRVAEECRKLLPVCRRNQDRLELFEQVVNAQILRFRAQFATLEMEYFYATWDRVPPDFRARIGKDIRAVEHDINLAMPALQAAYARTLTAVDARELVSTQLAFFRDNMLLVAQKMFGDNLPAPS